MGTRISFQAEIGQGHAERYSLPLHPFSDKHIVDRFSFPDMHDSFFPGKMGNSSSDKYPQKRKMQQQVSPVLSPEPFPAKKDHYQLDSQYPL